MWRKSSEASLCLSTLNRHTNWIQSVVWLLLGHKIVRKHRKQNTERITQNAERRTQNA